ncbi:RuvC-like resolvase [Mycobacterium phage Rhinoforte]|uniref:RuvC-like resolvase n=1 Tax=Mycobacterium phage Rhinoforte TaxID=2599878 RepID=A0A5J6TT07_9CAUD|nr:RuvC-like resolvase [Mycobacterium phage Rhinoforte]
MPRILGIDTSLTGTGLARAVLPDVQRGVDMPREWPAQVDLATVGASKPKKGDTWLARSRRVHEVLDGIAGALDDGHYDAVGLEELAYGAKGDAVVVLHWLWGEVVNLVRLRDIPLYLVNVSGVKKFATGNGNAKKDEVMLAMANRFPQYAIKDNNQSDALVVCMMTARHCGVPFETMPLKHLESMTKVVQQ